MKIFALPLDTLRLDLVLLATCVGQLRLAPGLEANSATGFFVARFQGDSPLEAPPKVSPKAKQEIILLLSRPMAGTNL